MFTNLKFDSNGLITAVIQDNKTAKVLMVGYMNAQSLSMTVETGEVWFYSRSRQKLWHKGETSGNVLRVDEILVDCDGDALLIKASPQGPTCHTGEISCFFKDLKGDIKRQREDILIELLKLIEKRKSVPKEGSYTSSLFEKGLDKILKKFGEEAIEVIIASQRGSKEEVLWEMADMIYHFMVLITELGISPEELKDVLSKRRK